MRITQVLSGRTTTQALISVPVLAALPAASPSSAGRSDTPASAKVAMPVWHASAARRINVASVAPVVTTLVVGLIAVAPAPNHTTHSVAADSELNRIFVPVSHEGVKVYTEDRDNGEGPDK